MAEVSLAPWARNTTGQPSARRYSLGRGKILSSALDASDDPTGGYLHLGNAPRISSTLSRQFLDHYSSLAGRRDRDARIPIEDTFSVGFQLEEPTEEAGALGFQSTPSAYTNPTIAGITERTLVSAVALGRYYPILNSSGDQAHGVDKDDLTVKKTGSPDVTLDYGIDYTVDEADGTIFVYSTAVKIAAGDAMKITLLANPLAESMRNLNVLDTTEIERSLQLYLENGRDETRWLLHIPKASIAPDGGLELVTAQDLLQIPLVASAVKKNTSTPLAWLRALPPGGVT
jgi:hypothetical protein